MATPEEQAKADRAALDRAGVGDVIEGARRTAIAGADIATLPGRAVMGAVNTALRVPNAYGAGIPYIPEAAFGGDSSSMTPFYDRYVRGAGAAPSTPAIPNDQGRLGADGKPVVSAMESYNRSPESRAIIAARAASASPKAAPVASYKPEPDVTSTFTAYASKNPASAFDDDIRLMHNMARVYSLVPGFEQKAKMYRDTYSQLNGERIKEVSDNAQRAFAAGDITAGIDAFNHMVPNGRKITGYRQNPDKTYTFKFADGSEDTRSADQVAGTIATMGNPGLVATMMQARAKVGAELGKDLALAGVKHQYSLIQAQQQGLIDVQKGAYLEQLKAQLDPKGHVTVGMDGTPYINTRDGVYKVEDRPNPLDPKQRVPTPVKVMGLGPQQGQQSGYAFNPGAITSGVLDRAGVR